MTYEELNEAIRYLEEEKLVSEATLYGENQDKYDNTIMLIDDAKFRESRKPLTIYDRAIKALGQTRWIPISERLPEDYIHVLCQLTLGGMVECYLAHGAFHVVGGLVMTCNEVIAWMPLPQPYKAESEEENEENYDIW